jgi:uncharacterized protein
VSLLNRRFGIITAVILAELAGVAFAYQVFTDFECRAIDSQVTCWFLRTLVARAIVALAALGLYAWLRRPAFASPRPGSAAAPSFTWDRSARLAPVLDPDPQLNSAHRWLAVHLLGVAILLQPLFLVPVADPGYFFSRSLLPWLLGSSLAATGAVFWLAPPQDWKDWVVQERYAPLAVFGVATLLPDLSNLIQPAWHWHPVTTATFKAVLLLLSLVGAEIYSDTQEYIVGLEGFYVQVAQQCSGIEGFALIASFVALHGILFRKELRFPHYWLIVLPLGLAASWILNAVRIFALLLIGARVSPQIAVNGFHSYAGWMLFTLLALALIWLVHTMPALRAHPIPRKAVPLRDDDIAARILPFSLFLLAGIVGAAVTPDPELAAPLQAVVVALALGYFWPNLVRLGWTMDLLSLGAGILVGLAWIATDSGRHDGGALREVLSGFGPIVLGSWIVLRVLGTAVLVPIMEENFFRGYLLARLDLGGLAGKVFAIIVSTALFAAMHSRWLEAFVAGLVFALVMLRRGRLSDAMLAHIAANSVVALAALIRGDVAAI